MAHSTGEDEIVLADDVGGETKVMVMEMQRTVTGVRATVKPVTSIQLSCRVSRFATNLTNDVNIQDDNEATTMAEKCASSIVHKVSHTKENHYRREVGWLAKDIMEK